MQIVKGEVLQMGQAVTHRRYGAGTIRALFAFHALVEFDGPFREKTVPVGDLHHDAGKERNVDNDLPLRTHALLPEEAGT